MVSHTTENARPATVAPTVLFDLDGTLVHTSPDIAAALNATFARHGRSITVGETERMIGDGLETLFRRTLRAVGLDPSDNEAEAMFRSFVARYRERPAALSSAHAWVAEVLADLHRDGARLAVCTNKAEDIAVAILEKLDLARWLHAVVGHMPGREKKPSAEPVHLAIARAGGRPPHAVLVGDSRADVDAARAAGIPIVLVPHGYGAEPATGLGADCLAATGAELRAAIKSLARRLGTV